MILSYSKKFQNLTIEETWKNQWAKPLKQWRTPFETAIRSSRWKQRGLRNGEQKPRRWGKQSSQRGWKWVVFFQLAAWVCSKFIVAIIIIILYTSGLKLSMPRDKTKGVQKTAATAAKVASTAADACERDLACHHSILGFLHFRSR